MPGGAEILCVQTQNNQACNKQTPCIWAKVDTDNAPEQREFDVIGTGHAISEMEYHEHKYIDTFQLSGGALIFHVFEKISLI